MNDHDELESKVRSWLASEAPQRAPDRLRHRVDSNLADVPQAGRWGSLLPGFHSGRRSNLVPGLLLVAGAIIATLVGALGAGKDQPSEVPRTSATQAGSTAAATNAPTSRPTPPGSILPAGANVSQHLVPQVTFEVPAGWTRVADIDVELFLAPPGAGLTAQPGGGDAFDNIGIYVDPVAGAADGSAAIDPTVGRDAKGLATWLAARPQLVASKPVAATVAGLSGFLVDVEVGPGAGGLCGIRCVNLFNLAGGVQFGILEHEVVRVILLDRVGGGTLMITIEDVDGVDVVAFRAVAQPVIDSLRVAPGASPLQ